MTTKPKTRKPAPRARAPMTEPENPHIDARFPIENRYDRNFASNDIPKLIARWRFLEADRQYHAATATDSELGKCSLHRHTEERAKIVEKLLCTVPESLDDTNALLKFSIETLAITLGPTLGIDTAKSTPVLRMLKNVSKGILKSEVKLKIDAIVERASAREDERNEFLT